MNLDDDDESVFERALRADLPTASEQNRLRLRILAGGMAAGTVLGSTSLAAAGQASLGASAVSKLSALSWPAKLGLSAALAAPIVGAAALPLVSENAPVRAASLVSQVRSSVASVRAQSVARAALSRVGSAPLEAPPTRQPEPEPESAAANVAARAPLQTSSNLPTPVAANPLVNGKAGAPQSAVAAFDSAAHGAPASESERPGNASTLAVETQLLERAFAALAAGDRSTATALVAEHARLFPTGLLSRERESARARLARDPKGE